MDFFASGLNALRGQKGQHQTGSETVDRLCERIEHGTLLEDRRASVLALKACAREHKRDIATRGVLVLCKVLRQDSMDIDISKAVLETLTVLCQPDSDHEESREFALEMSNAFLQDAGNVAILLDMLEESDFYVRFHVVSLMSVLVLNNTPRLQECVLTSPMGMSRLMALLDDRREIIRNEGLLLLISLTESNADLQKIVAFENAFERLLAIIDDEGAISGGIIVQDCLQLVQNLLRYNVSNQNYFRETSCIQRIPALFEEETIDDSGRHNYAGKDVWSDQKGNNMIMVLELIRVLVVPDHSNTIPNQKSMYQCGILQLLIDLSLASSAPQRVKASAFYALAELIRLNKVNQDALSKAVITPAHPPLAPSENLSSSLTPPGRSSAQLSRSSFQSGRGSAQGDRFPHGYRHLEPRERCPAIVEVVAIAVGQYPGCTYSVRAAATCLFQTFVLENPDTQMVLATTLNPPPEDNPNTASNEKPRSPGTLLLGALQGWQDDAETASTDPYNSWFATVLFSHILQNNARAKAIALAITFGDEEHGEDPVSLIHAIAAALMVAVKGRADVRVALGYLALLCVWCYDSPKSIKDFLSEGAHLQFLIELISPSSKEDLMVQGLAAFLLGICYEFNWEQDALISRATIQPIILSRIGLDHFAACITRVRESKPFNAAVPFMVVLPSEESEGRLPGLYFDYSFVEFMKRTFERTQKSITLSPDNRQSQQTSSQTTNAEIEIQLASMQSKVTTQNAEMEELRAALDESQRMLAQQAHERQEYERELAEMREKLRESEARHTALEREHEDLLICLAEQDEELTVVKERLLSLGVGGGHAP
ncbi:p115 like vesicle tethering protein [Gamsiella multidivaricata]|uniref:p115 like vesicle tethering protein n=1 Tax=Gamsiella multidivaricata TaxID=101098 RepID=UPI00221FE51B|nr:p115 like vesicle tethering protein [Gamsiella multidivaricata]KAI7816738.1 p115 like vesicle tethering protein [Gamsiella multidivaricata]